MEAHFQAATAAVVARGDYATYALVAQAVSAAHGVATLQQLGPAVNHSASANLLLHIEDTVAQYASAFVASHGIATLKDFEREVVSILVSRCTPPMALPHQNGSNLSHMVPSSFVDFGVGPLVRHPAVRYHWGASIASDFVPALAIGYAEAAQLLLRYLSQHRQLRQAGSASSLVVDSAALVIFIEEVSGHTLSQQGILLVQHALPSALSALSHAAHALADLEVSAANLALQQMQTRPDYRAVQEAAATKGKRTPDYGAVPKLKGPTDPLLLRVLARTRELVPRYPNLTAVHTAVQQMASPRPPRKQNKKMAAVVDKMRSTRAGQGGSGKSAWDEEAVRSDTWTEDASGVMLHREACLSLVAEYIMLHVGSTRWRARKYETSSAGRDEATESAGGNDQEGAEADHSQPSPSSSLSSSSSSSSQSSSELEGQDDGSVHRDERDGGGTTRKRRRRGASVGCAAPSAAQQPLHSSSVTPEHVTQGVGLQSTTPEEAEAAVCAPAELDPNEIALDGDDEIDEDKRGAGNSGKAQAVKQDVCDSPHEARAQKEITVQVHVDVASQAPGAAPTLPPRLNTTRQQPKDGVLCRTLEPHVLLSSGCLPWRGSITVSEALDASDHRAVGRWGEALVYNYLVSTLPPSRQVTWLNQAEEVKAPYDLVITERGAVAHKRGGGSVPTVFVEVKTTRYADNNVFDLSLFELEFMREPHISYVIYRVSGAGTAAPRIDVINQPLEAAKEGRARLCMAI